MLPYHTALEVDIRKAGDSEVKAVSEEVVLEVDIHKVVDSAIKAVLVAAALAEAVAISAVAPLQTISKPFVVSEIGGPLGAGLGGFGGGFIGSEIAQGGFGR